MIAKHMAHFAKIINTIEIRMLQKKLAKFSIYKNVFPKMEHAAKFLEFHGQEQRAIIVCAIRFGCVGISEEKSAQYAIGLWNAIYNCGLHIETYVPAYQNLCNGIARGYLSREDLNYIIQFCPKMGQWLRVARNIHTQITEAHILAFLEDLK